MAARIVVTITEKGGSAREEVFDLTELTFGRVQGNDIVLPKGNISKRHTRIVLRDGKLIVVDLKTTNGTFVNGKRISSPQVLKDADKIYIGDFTVTARVDGAGASEPAPLPPPPPPRPPRSFASGAATTEGASPMPPHGTGPRVVVEVDGGPPTVLGLLRTPIGIGRHPENDIVIDNRTLSRFHARIERRGDAYVAMDLGAQNGLFVNDVRVSGERALAEGDRIGCGRARITIWGIAQAGVTPSGGAAAGAASADEAVQVRRVIAALRDPHVREVRLSEDEPVEITPPAAAPGAAAPVTRRVVLAVLERLDVGISAARPVVDTTIRLLPGWRVTAQCIDGAPVRARFKRAAQVSLDDDIDPLPPA